MPNRARLARLTVAGALAAAVLAVTAGPASATDPTRPAPPSSRVAAALEDIKKEGADAIADRQAQLTKLAGRLSASPGCDSAGKVAGVITADQSGLAAVGAELSADTTVATAKDDFQSIFQDYRVYLVVTPQASATSACGHIQSALGRMHGVETKLADQVSAAEAAGADMTSAKAALADLRAKTTDAGTLANTAATSLQTIGPDHGDQAVAASNKAAVDKARRDLETAARDLKDATADAKAVVKELKAARH